jgi:hypothetical protein
MTRETLPLSLLVVLLLLVFSTVEAQKVGIAKTQSEKFQVKVSDGFLFLEANEAPLVQIFGEIGKQAKIAVDTSIGSEEKITIRLDRVPLEDGIRQLAKNVSVFYAQDPRSNTRRIARVVVLSEAGGLTGQTKAPSKPEKVNEPAAKPEKVTKPQQQPEPFKFEFDPRKAAEKKETPVE